MTENDMVMDPVPAHPGVLALPRRRGVVIGILLVLLGLWGGLSALIGPSFGYHVDDDQLWVLNADRLWLQVVPGAVVVIGGLMLWLGSDRITASIGAWLAIAGGVWFGIGPSMSALWSSNLSVNGIGRGSTEQKVLIQLLSFYGLGVVITGLAGFGLALVMVRTYRDAMLLQAESDDAVELARFHHGSRRAQLEAEREAEARSVYNSDRGPLVHDSDRRQVVAERDIEQERVADADRRQVVAERDIEQERMAESDPRDTADDAGVRPADQELAGDDLSRRYRERTEQELEPVPNRGPLPRQRSAPAISGEYPATSAPRRD